MRSATKQKACIVNVLADQASGRVASVVKDTVGVTDNAATVLTGDSVAIGEPAGCTANDLVLAVADVLNFQTSRLLPDPMISLTSSTYESDRLMWTQVEDFHLLSGCD